MDVSEIKTQFVLFKERYPIGCTVRVYMTDGSSRLYQVESIVPPIGTYKEPLVCLSRKIFQSSCVSPMERIHVRLSSMLESDIKVVSIPRFQCIYDQAARAIYDPFPN